MANVDIIIRTIDQSGGKLGKLDGGLAQLASRYLSVAVAAGALTTATKFVIEQAAEAQRVDAKLAAVLASTGGAAGMTAEELDKMAVSLSRLSTFDDEAIKSSEALLLTFTKVGKEVFPEAQQAILNMSTALGQDLQSSTIQLGKALNDPIAGITALKRVGVSFTDEQRNMIKVLVESGDTLAAQKLILHELTVEFGGQALAASKTYTGQIQQLQNEVGNLGEVIGGELLPPLTQLIGGFTDLARIQQDANALMDSGENTYLRGAIAQAAVATALDRQTQSTQDADAARIDAYDSLETTNDLTGDLAGSTEEYVTQLQILQGVIAGETGPAQQYLEEMFKRGVPASEAARRAISMQADSMRYAGLTALEMGKGTEKSTALIAQNVPVVVTNFSNAATAAHTAAARTAYLNEQLWNAAKKAGSIWDYYFNIYVNGTVPSFPGGGGGNFSGGALTEKGGFFSGSMLAGMADGGTFMVPSGYNERGGSPYMAAFSAGEQVTVTPAKGAPVTDLSPATIRLLGKEIAGALTKVWG